MAAKRDIGGLRPLITVIGVLIQITGAQTKTITAEEGQNITLNVTYTGEPTLITWKKDGNIVGEIILNPPRAPYLYILQDRATISDTGNLIIRDLIKGDSGNYTAEVTQNGGQTDPIYTELIVVAQTIKAKVEESATLRPSFTGDNINDTRLTRDLLCPDPMLKGLDSKSFAFLTIMNFLKFFYTTEGIQNEEKTVDLRKKRNLFAQTIKAKVGESATLPVTYRGNTTVITWKRNCDIEVGKIVLNLSDPYLNILQDRASISNTGSLIIRGLIEGDSGLYTAEVTQDGKLINIIQKLLVVEEKSSGSSYSHTGYIVTIIILCAVILGLLYYFRKEVQKIISRLLFWKRNPKDGENPGVMAPINASGDKPIVLEGTRVISSEEEEDGSRSYYFNNESEKRCEDATPSLNQRNSPPIIYKARRTSIEGL